MVGPARGPPWLGRAGKIFEILTLKTFILNEF
jgi:hypothetical protein